MTIRSNITLDEALSDYSTNARGGYSPNTWEAHSAALERWAAWMDDNVQPGMFLKDVAEGHMGRYYDRLRPPKLSERTFNNYRQYIQMFFQYCRGEDWITRNPMRHIRAMRVRESSKLYLSAGEMLRMLDDAEPRDRAFLAVAQNTLLRAQDITALKVADVNFESMSLTAWIEKTDRFEVFPMTQELGSELTRWLREYATANGVVDVPNHWALLPTVQYLGVNPHRPELGGRLTYVPGKMINGEWKRTQMVHPEKIVHLALGKLGLDGKGNGIHALRRSGARCLYNILSADPGFKGEPIRIVQAMLGHKNQSTTEIYLGITHERRLRDEMLRGQSFLGRAVEHDRQLQQSVTESRGLRALDGGYDRAAV